MDQDMNSYLEQLRARAEKRLQNESDSADTAAPSAKTAPETETEDVKPSSLSVDDIIKEADTLRYDLPKVTYDNESEKMMGDLMEWADREPTVPFEPVSEENLPAEADEPVQASSEENDEDDDTAEAVTETKPEPDLSSSRKKKVFKSKPETDDDEDDGEDILVDKPRKLSNREQRKRAKEFRRALVEKENGSGRGLIGEIFYVILFVILVILTILAVLYLLQTIAGIKILDVEAIFDIVFGWITSKILH